MRSTGGGASGKALVIRGCTGKYAIINCAYEPRGSHGSFPCWVSRTNPCCIFHTGKSRWVVGKELDDGGKCYAFMQDDGSENPALSSGNWVICNERGDWADDPAIKCMETSVSNDPFVRVRYTLDDEMLKVGISSDAKRDQMWHNLDRNGDGNCDLAEVEAFVGQLCKTGVWPLWLGNETALERAYRKTLEESGDDDKVEKEDFHALLLNIFWFGKLHDIFDEIDVGNDDTLDMHEFHQGLDKLGIKLAPSAIEQEFQSIDADGSGEVDFGEFCLYIRKRMEPNPSDGTTEADNLKSAAQELLRQSGAGDAATTGSMVRKKNFVDFDNLEKKIKDVCAEGGNKGLKKMWKQLDFNGNNIVSLAEIDKWVVEKYPLLNHKPALIRAQKATLAQGNGNDWVEKKEFKFLVTNLFYYNKLFWLFDQADAGKDHRMDFKEFQWCLSMCGLKLSPTKAKAEFDKVDSDRGGQILFDEFCQYFVAKKCPEGMTQFIADE